MDMEIKRLDWLKTSAGQPRGYIQPGTLEELWFHTGTACNLECPFCLEGSRPGDNRLQRITLRDAKPFMDEAMTLSVRQFSFTGGEPFIIKDFINILTYGSELLPCLVLTNGTDPVLKRLHRIETLKDSAHPINFRVSIDYPDEKLHDLGRGTGNFQKTLEGLRSLHNLGFAVSVARQMQPDEDTEAINVEYRSMLESAGLPANLRIVAFPDFDTPGAKRNVPDITEDCMTRYQTENTRREFMCSFSKMVIKKNGRMRVYACTLVDDDDDYDQGGILTESLSARVMLRHHRCYSCFTYGSSCSEIDH